MNEYKAKMLIVEDEQSILAGLQDVFVFHGYQVDSAMDGELALEKALNNDYDMILLDVMLPKLDGFSVCNQIRAHDLQVPIVMLTAKSTEEDIITGLTLGADDYVGKPFSVRELVLRVQSVLKRTRPLALYNQVLQIGEMQIDIANLQEIGCERPQLFTRREIDILTYLQHQAHRPVPREELLHKIWGYEQPESIETRTVDIHIAKLRRKIEPDPKQPVYLITVRGEGYRLIDHEKI